MASTLHELFSNEFLAMLEPLRLDARPAPPSDAAGQHLSRAVGASLDFRDFRPYAPGDDLRRVDWNAYRRTGGSLFVRRFDQPTTTPVDVLIDDSASMFVEADAPRFIAAARIAAAIAAAALNAGDPVRVGTFDQPFFGGAAVSGRRRLSQVLAAFAAVVPSDQSSLSVAIDRLLARGGRTGIVVIISDFFHTAGVEALIAQLERLPSRLILAQIVRVSDADPTLLVREEVELIDCETGTVATVAPIATALAAYRAAYAAFDEALISFARRRGAIHHKLDAADESRAQLAALFPSGVLRAAGGRR